MGDAEDLMPFAERLHLRADGVGDFAADIGVDFVEDEQRDGVLRGERDFTASMTREISPLEAMALSGLAGSPGFGAKRNSARLESVRAGLGEGAKCD